MSQAVQAIEDDPPELVCREAELARIDALITAAAAGRGGAIVVVGGPGIGKSALLQRACRIAATAGVRSLLARGAHAEDGMPFGVARQLFERPLRELEETVRHAALDGAAGHARLAVGAAVEPAGGGDQFGVVHGLYWLASNFADLQPCLLVVDDAHWADPESARWLAYLAARLADLPLAVIIALRPGEAGDGDLLAGLEGADVTRVGLDPLDEHGTGAVVRARLGDGVEPEFVSACHAASGGNPFYLHELLRAAAADEIEPTAGGAATIPHLGGGATARSVLLRIGRLGDDAHRLAVAVAILEGRATLARAARLAQIETAGAAAAWDRLVAADLLLAVEPLDFIHPIVRSAILSELPPGEQGRLHLRAAELLAEATIPPEVVAAHAMAAPTGSDDRVAAWLRDAARAALATGAPDAAVRFLRRALEEPLGPADTSALRLELGMALLAAGSPDAAETFAAAAAGALPERQFAAERWRGYALAYAGRIRQALEAFDRAGDLVGDDADARLHLFGTRDFYALWWSHDDDRETRVAQAIERARTLPGDTRGERRALAAALLGGVMSGELSAARTLEIAERAARGGLTFLDPEDGDETAGVIQLAHLLTDQLDTAGLFEERVGELTARGWSLLSAGAQYALATCRLRQGALLEAEIHARTSWRVIGSLGASAGTVFWWSAAVLLSVLLARGELDDAAALVDAAGLDDAPSDIVIFPWPAVLLGELALARGRPTEGIERLLSAGAWLEQRGFTNPAFIPWRASVAPALAAAGRVDEARRIIEPAVLRARAFGSPWALGMALRAAGMVERGDASLALLGEAVSILEASPCRSELAHAQLALGTALRRERRRADAREPLRVALDLAARCGAQSIADRARDELAATGARVRRDRLTGVASLTAAERRVAHMAAEGRSNADIAQTLFLSRKTIEAHLGHVYAKLGIASRNSLADTLGERGES